MDSTQREHLREKAAAKLRQTEPAGTAWDSASRTGLGRTKTASREDLLRAKIAEVHHMDQAALGPDHKAIIKREGAKSAEVLAEELVAQQERWEQELEDEWESTRGGQPLFGPGSGEARTVFERQRDDLVNSPGHYAGGEGIECIDAIRQALGHEGFLAFCHGNAFKYVWRAKFKENFEQDMAKAAWYARMAAGDDPRKST